MSNHIDHNITPPKPQHCCGDMSFNHETGEMKGPSDCGCAPSEIKPTKLDLLIAQYKELLKETTKYRDALIAAALGLNGIETESDAAVNRQIIIDTITAAIPSVSSIQSGLAKTSELPVIPTDYAKDATVAKEAAATANTNAILAAIASIVFDTTDLAKEATVAKQGTNANATLTAVLEALTGGDDPSPDIPEGVAERLAMILEHFGIKTISGYEFMTDTEVTGELEDIMQAIDNGLTARQAATITAEAMEIINSQNS